MFTEKSFKNMIPFEERFRDTKNILIKYPDRIPIICERSKTANKDCPMIDKNKYLIQMDLTMGQFIYVIRKRLNIPAEKAIFLFVNDSLLPSSTPIGNIYDLYKDNDNFLYISYSFENTFGYNLRHKYIIDDNIFMIREINK
jgi:GABA(A) receptor-associated protein